MKVEEMLNKKKLDIDNIEIPEELEDRLKGALNDASMKVKKRNWFIRHKLTAAVLALIVFTGASNYNALAYYGKKILGYDEVTYGTLKELNNEGMGQEINKSYTFKNGTIVTLNGAMLDENKLVLMYKIKGNTPDIVGDFTTLGIEGRVKRYYEMGGYGHINEDGKEMSWVQEYQSPSLFDTKITFKLQCTSKDVSNGEVANITFKLDMNKAIKRTVKTSIEKSVEAEGVKYNFTKMTATPLSVVIEGSLTGESINDKLGVIFGKEGSRKELALELIETFVKDGKTVTEVIPTRSSGMGSSMGEITFKYEFDGLKSGIKSLELKVVKTQDMKMIAKEFAIKNGTSDFKVIPDSEDIIIKAVKADGNNTKVIFNTPADVEFDTALFIGEKQAQTLSTSINKIKVHDKDINEKIYNFEGNGDNMRLLFKEYSRVKYINETIELYKDK